MTQVTFTQPMDEATGEIRIDRDVLIRVTSMRERLRQIDPYSYNPDVAQVSPAYTQPRHTPGLQDTNKQAYSIQYFKLSLKVVAYIFVTGTLDIGGLLYRGNTAGSRARALSDESGHECTGEEGEDRRSVCEDILAARYEHELVETRLPDSQLRLRLQVQSQAGVSLLDDEQRGTVPPHWLVTRSVVKRLRNNYSNKEAWSEEQGVATGEAGDELLRTPAYDEVLESEKSSLS